MTPKEEKVCVPGEDSWYRYSMVAVTQSPPCPGTLNVLPRGGRLFFYKAKRVDHLGERGSLPGMGLL
jgi:hypothetical protein